MDRIKIVFFDIDGTLLNFGAKGVTEKTRQTLEKLRQEGILLCIATGRSPVVVPKFEGLKFDAYVTYNGSYCYDESGVIFSSPIAPDDVQTLMANAAAIGRPLCVATSQRLAANGWDVDLADYYALAHLQLKVDADFAEVARQPVYQVMMGCRESEHPAILRDLPNMKIAISWDRAVDVIPADGGKGRGILKVLEHFGLRPENALAFGDGNNDIEMLQTVGTGVAMGNASDALKAVADDVCGHVAEDGIYHYCLSHGLI